MRAAVVAIVLVAALAGCGAQHSRAAPRRGPIGPLEWREVLQDWYVDGAVDHPHPCAAVVLAIAHLPVSPPTYSTVARDLGRAVARWCPRRPDLDALRVGMSDADVAARAGAPGRVLVHCWLYPVTRDDPGRRVCFTRGRVTTLQYSLHLQVDRVRPSPPGSGPS